MSATHPAATRMANLAGALLIAFLFAVFGAGTAAAEQSASPEKSNSARPAAAAGPPASLSGNELTSVAALLSKAGLRSYRYLAIGQSRGGDGKLKFEIKRDERIKGLLMSRPDGVMKSLGNGLFDDRAGNLVFKGTLTDGAGKEIPYAITSTKDGRSIVSADRDNDGVVDILAGSGRGGRPWLMGNRGLGRLLLCFEEAGFAGGSGMIAAARLCVPCLEANAEPGAPLTAEERGCVNRNRGRGSGSSGGSGGLGSGPGSDLLAPPNCGPARPGGIDRGITSDVNESTSVGDLRDKARREGRIADSWKEHKNGVSDPAQRRRAREVEEAYQTSEHEYDRAAVARDRANRANEFAREVGSDPDATDAEKDAADDLASRAMIDLIAATERANQAANRARSQAARYHREFGNRSGGGTRQPGIDPAGGTPGGFQDPRCGSIGRSSHWSELCRQQGGDAIDVIDCFRRLADPVYARTNGRCWQETDEADRTVVRCRSEDRDGGRGGNTDGGPPPVGGASNCPTDHPNCIRRGGGGPGRAVDVSPLGGFLAAFCAKGGCPDFAPMDNVQREPTSGTLPSPDLAVSKRANQANCGPGQVCFTVTVTNNSPFPYTGSLRISDVTTAAGVRMATVQPAAWSCTGSGGRNICTLPETTLEAGASKTLSLTFAVSPHQRRAVQNCAELAWRGAMLEQAQDNALQQALSDHGQQATAIAQYRRMSAEVKTTWLRRLFGRWGKGDIDGANDKACAAFPIERPANTAGGSGREDVPALRIQPPARTTRVCAPGFRKIGKNCMPENMPRPGRATPQWQACPKGWRRSAKGCVQMALPRPRVCPPGWRRTAKGCLRPTRPRPTSCPKGWKRTAKGCMQVALPRPRACPPGWRRTAKGCYRPTKPRLPICPKGWKRTAKGCMQVALPRPRACPPGWRRTAKGCYRPTRPRPTSCPQGHYFSPTTRRCVLFQ